MLFSYQFVIQNLLSFENFFQSKCFENQKIETSGRCFFIFFFCFVVLVQGWVIYSGATCGEARILVWVSAFFFSFLKKSKNTILFLFSDNSLSHTFFLFSYVSHSLNLHLQTPYISLWRGYLGCWCGHLDCWRGPHGLLLFPFCSLFLSFHC